MTTCRDQIKTVRPAFSADIHQHQVGIVGLGAGCREHGVDLTAMMRLVIEEMGQQNPLRLADVFLEQSGIPMQIALQPIVSEAQIQYIGCRQGSEDVRVRYLGLIFQKTLI